MTASLKDSYTLPCGLVLQNRLVKAALAEDLAENQSPGPKLQTLYKSWAKGGWGAVMTGNVMVDATTRGSPGDVTLPPPGAKQKSNDETLEAWTKWANIIQAEGGHAIMQINHPGRQSPRNARDGQSVAPSAIPLNFGDSYFAALASKLAFGTPRELSIEEIQTIVRQFAACAKMASDAGFRGVEIHGAHGYLIAQFLSPSSNKRTDDYGGTPIKRARIVKEVLREIRAVTPAGFCVGLKINSVDHSQTNGLAECLEQVKYITEESLDFLEISGGTYEKAEMIEGREDITPAAQLKPTARTAAREAYFLEYAHSVRNAFPSLPLMVTGGFRTRVGMQNALSSGGCDIIGLGRPAVENPCFPSEIILNDKVSDKDATVAMDQVPVPWFVQVTGLKPLKAGLVTLHYQKVMSKMIGASA